MQDLVAAAAALEKLRKEAEAAKQLAEKSAAAHTYGVDRATDRKNAALVVARLTQLQNVRPCRADMGMSVCSTLLSAGTPYFFTVAALTLVSVWYDLCRAHPGMFNLCACASLTCA